MIWSRNKPCKIPGDIPGTKKECSLFGDFTCPKYLKNGDDDVLLRTVSGLVVKVALEQPDARWVNTLEPLDDEVRDRLTHSLEHSKENPNKYLPVRVSWATEILVTYMRKDWLPQN